MLKNKTYTGQYVNSHLNHAAEHMKKSYKNVNSIAFNIYSSDSLLKQEIDDISWDFCTNSCGEDYVKKAAR